MFDKTIDLTKYNTCNFIEVHIDPFQLKVRVSMIRASWIDAVLVCNDLPKLKCPNYET